MRKRFLRRMIGVLNKGTGGEEAPVEFKRFKRDVIDEAPSLVIWQVGTNAIFRPKDFSVEETVEKIAEGLQRLSGLAMDVVLMDLQYVPAMLLTTRRRLPRAWCR